MVLKVREYLSIPSLQNEGLSHDFSLSSLGIQIPCLHIRDYRNQMLYLAHAESAMKVAFIEPLLDIDPKILAQVIVCIC